jgi:acyl-homoserine lactone synthase
MLDRGNFDHFADSLEGCFRLRHEIFVKERGWQQFAQNGKYERDKFDDDNASYLLAIEDDGAVVGCFRLIPTLLPHLFSEVFPHFIEGDVPRSGNLIELSRVAIAKNQRGTRVYYELFAGLQEYCLERNITGVTALMKTLRMPIVQNAGMKITPLGLPREMDGESLTAIMLDISEDILSRVRKSGGISGSVMEATVLADRMIA